MWGFLATVSLTTTTQPCTGQDEYSEWIAEQRMRPFSCSAEVMDRRAAARPFWLHENVIRSCVVVVS